MKSNKNKVYNKVWLQVRNQVLDQVVVGVRNQV